MPNLLDIPVVQERPPYGRAYSDFGTVIRAPMPASANLWDIVFFDPIYPAPVRDFREFDFTGLVNDPAATIDTATWSCAVSPDSPVDDPDAATRLIGAPIITGQKTKHMVGDCLAECEYILTAEVAVSDGRIFVLRGVLPCIAYSLTPAPPQLLPNGAVIFDYNHWVSVFPEFKSVTEEQANTYWQNACMILRNDATSPVQDPIQRQMLLELLTAHIASQFGGPMGGGGFSGGMTGLVTSKSVNGVSIGSTPFAGIGSTQQFYMTSKYGIDFWMKTRSWRSFHYVPGPQRFPNFYFPYGYYGVAPPVMYYSVAGGGIPDAPRDGGHYVRWMGQWIAVRER